MASYNSSAAFTIPRHIRAKDGINVQAITDTITLTYSSSQYQILTLTAVSAKTCMLPAVKNGGYFYIKNASGSNQPINVNDPSTGGTVSTITVGQGVLVVCDGSAWLEVIKA
jgi:hypothetical protein